MTAKKKKQDVCEHCGGKGDLIFISNGGESKVRHATPWQCIEHLAFLVKANTKRTAGLTVFGGPEK